eukprot:scaffold111306_cov63-Phaeocystis_antarctica.AAC.1
MTLTARGPTTRNARGAEDAQEELTGCELQQPLYSVCDYSRVTPVHSRQPSARFSWAAAASIAAATLHPMKQPREVPPATFSHLSPRPCLQQQDDGGT